MNADVAMRKAIQRELIKRFNASKAKNHAIVITMKVDGVKLILVPDWCLTRKRDIEHADAFTVYVDLVEGRAALPYMAACSIEELAYNITNYSGIDLWSADEAFIYYMNQCEDYVADYDMYDEKEREELFAYQYRQRVV